MTGLTERQEQILAALAAEMLAAEIDPTEQGGLADDELARQLGITEEEVRRDVAELTDRGLIARDNQRNRTTPMTGNVSESELQQAERHAEYAHNALLVAAATAWRTDAVEAHLKAGPGTEPYHALDVACAEIALAGAALRMQLWQVGRVQIIGRGVGETFNRLRDMAAGFADKISAADPRSTDPEGNPS